MSADPAQVGLLFASGDPEKLKALDLTVEAARLVDIGEPRRAEALIVQTLRLCPLHPQAFQAVDSLIQQVRSDRSVPDQDRLDAVRQTARLGVDVAKAWVDHYKTGPEAARAEFFRIQYLYRSLQGSPEADAAFSRELAAFLVAYPDSDLAGQASLRLSEFLADTGRFQRIIDLDKQLAGKRGRVPVPILARALYEVGDFPAAAKLLASGDLGSGLTRIGRPRDVLARLRFYLGDAAGGMELVRREALVRTSNVFVDVENGWLEIPNFRRLSSDFILPEGAQWAADVNLQLQAVCVTAYPDLLDGTPVSASLNVPVLQLAPLSLPQRKLACSLSLVTPIALETSVPYGIASSSPEGYRTAWPLDLVVTPDNYVNVPRFWARSRAGVLRNPPCRVWRTSKPLDDNLVQVDIFFSTPYESILTIDNQHALIEPAPVANKRTIQLQFAAGDLPSDPRKPDKPVCSYVVRPSRNVKSYLPAVTVVLRSAPAPDASKLPPASKWRWDVAGFVLQIDSTDKLSLRNLSISSNFRYQLTEFLEPAP